MNNKSYGFTNYQQQKIFGTVEKVTTAIANLTEEGSLITKSRLVKETGLSRATFDKPHVLEVLRKFGVCEFAKIIENDENSSLLDTKLLKKIAKLEKENLALKDQIGKLKNTSNKYHEEYLETKEAYQYLLGEWHLLLTKARLKGIEIDESMTYTKG